MTPIRKEIISKELLAREVAAQIAIGKQPVLRAPGRSMHPYIRDGKDNLIFDRVDVAALCKGDMVFAKTTSDNYVMHRIVKVHPDCVILKGDGNLTGTECCRKTDIIARLVAIERDGRSIDCNTRKERLKAWIMRVAWRSVHMPVHLARRLMRRMPKQN